MPELVLIVEFVPAPLRILSGRAALSLPSHEPVAPTSFVFRSLRTPSLPHMSAARQPPVSGARVFAIPFAISIVWVGDVAGIRGVSSIANGCATLEQWPYRRLARLAHIYQ